MASHLWFSLATCLYCVVTRPCTHMHKQWCNHAVLSFVVVIVVCCCCCCCCCQISTSSSVSVSGHEHLCTMMAISHPVSLVARLWERGQSSSVHRTHGIRHKEHWLNFWASVGWVEWYYVQVCVYNHLRSNQSFYRQTVGYGMSVDDHRVAWWWKGVIEKQISYMTLIGVHEMYCVTICGIIMCVVICVCRTRED